MRNHRCDGHGSYRRRRRERRPSCGLNPRRDHRRRGRQRRTRRRARRSRRGPRSRTNDGRSLGGSGKRRPNHLDVGDGEHVFLSSSSSSSLSPPIPATTPERLPSGHALLPHHACRELMMSRRNASSSCSTLITLTSSHEIATCQTSSSSPGRGVGTGGRAPYGWANIVDLDRREPWGREPAQPDSRRVTLSRTAGPAPLQSYARPSGRSARKPTKCQKTSTNGKFLSLQKPAYAIAQLEHRERTTSNRVPPISRSAIGESPGAWSSSEPIDRTLHDQRACAPTRRVPRVHGSRHTG